VNGASHEVTGDNFIIKTPPSPQQFQSQRVSTAEIKKDLNKEASQQIRALRVVFFPPPSDEIAHLVRGGVNLADIDPSGNVVSVGAGNFAADRTASAT